MQSRDVLGEASGDEIEDSVITAPRGDAYVAARFWLAISALVAVL